MYLTPCVVGYVDDVNTVTYPDPDVLVARMVNTDLPWAPSPVSSMYNPVGDTDWEYCKSTE
jgi:hypothetical protein